jgi:quercetin dioxygenase-like cupin family protein
MNVISHAALPVTSFACGELRTVASDRFCETSLHIDVVSVDGAGRLSQPPSRAVRLIVVLEGAGKHRINGESTGFEAPCTLYVPRDAAHEIINNAACPLRYIQISEGEPPAPHSQA